jgi:hypothetical protein
MMHDRLVATTITVFALAGLAGADTTPAPLAIGFDRALVGEGLLLPGLDRGSQSLIAGKAVADRGVSEQPDALPDRDGVVRLWLRSSDPQVQLLATKVPVSSSGGAVRDVVCRAPVSVRWSAGIELGVRALALAVLRRRSPDAHTFA